MQDEVTLITRPRRFGKTLTMSMMEQFFSLKFAGRGDLFENLAIWREEKYRALQGTYPVISISFANVKETDYSNTRRKICRILTDLYADFTFLLDSDVLQEKDKEFFRRISDDMSNVDAMNEYMNRVTCEIFSFFDTGRRASGKAEPERFYHGFVL